MSHVSHHGRSLVSILLVLFLVTASLTARADDADDTCLAGITISVPDLFCSSKFLCNTDGFREMQYLEGLDGESACRCCPSRTTSTLNAADDCELAELAASHCERYPMGSWSATYGLCTECEYGYTLLDAPNPSSSCTLSCASILHCANCGSGTVCQECEDGYVLSEDALSCDSCPGNCQQCLGANSCGLCNTGYTLFDGRCVECSVSNCSECYDTNLCSTCEETYMLENNACVQCELENCVECSSPTVCTTCATSYTLLPDGSACVLCLNENCGQCSEENVCASCATGYTLTTGTGTCDMCRVNQCTECEAGSDGLSCFICDDGYTRQRNGLCGTTRSWPYFVTTCVGAGAIVLAFVVMLLWCANWLSCLPKCVFLLPFFSEEYKLPWIGDDRWRDEDTFLSPSMFPSLGKSITASSSYDSHDTEMFQFPGLLNFHSFDEPPERSAGSVDTVATRAVAESPVPSASPQLKQQPESPPRLEYQVSPNVAPDSGFSSRRRRVQFVLDDDITDRYVPSSTPILANAMWDVVVAQVPASVSASPKGPASTVTAAPTYDDVQYLSARPPEDAVEDFATQSHRVDNDAPHLPPVANPLARPSPSKEQSSRRKGLSAVDDAEDPWDYGTLSEYDGGDIAF